MATYDDTEIIVLSPERRRTLEAAAFFDTEIIRKSFTLEGYNPTGSPEDKRLFAKLQRRRRRQLFRRAMMAACVSLMITIIVWSIIRLSNQ